MNRENTTISETSEARGESLGVRGSRGGVGGMMKHSCSLTFEELVENVGTTSNEHHEIYNTLLQMLPENLVPSGELFFSRLFSPQASPLIFSFTGWTSTATSEVLVRHKLQEYRLLSFCLPNFGFVRLFLSVV